MRLLFVLQILTTCCLIGCQSSGHPRFTLFADQRKTEKAQSDTIADKDENPLKRPIPESDQILTVSGEKEDHSSRFTAQEEKLIKEELKQIPKEEHADLRERWSMMDPAYVLQEIRIRKQTRLLLEDKQEKASEEIASAFETTAPSPTAESPTKSQVNWGHSGSQQSSRGSEFAPGHNPFEQHLAAQQQTAKAAVTGGHSTFPSNSNSSAIGVTASTQSSPFEESQPVQITSPFANQQQLAGTMAGSPQQSQLETTALQQTTQGHSFGTPETTRIPQQSPAQPFPPATTANPASTSPSSGFVATLTNAPNSLREFSARLNPFAAGATPPQQLPPNNQIVTAKLPPNGSPLPGPASLPMNQQELLAQLIAILESEVEQNRLNAIENNSPENVDQYIQKSVQLRMLYLMTAQQARSLEGIPNIDPADQEFWVQLFWALSEYFNQQQIKDPTQRATQTVAQLQTAIQRLQEKAQLTLKNVNFCRNIDSFGNYEKFPKDEFQPGQPFLVYAEIENFTSELNSDSFYSTKLKTTIEFIRVDGAGDVAEPITIPAQEDLCRNYRRDYFHAYTLSVPKELPPGTYQMRLTVQDLNDNDIAEEIIPFRVLF